MPMQDWILELATIIVSWPVAGVAIAFLFRAEVRRLIDRVPSGSPRPERRPFLARPVNHRSE